MQSQTDTRAVHGPGVEALIRRSIVTVKANLYFVLLSTFFSVGLAVDSALVFSSPFVLAFPESLTSTLVAVIL
jgi:hypothetical protein